LHIVTQGKRKDSPSYMCLASWDLADVDQSLLTPTKDSVYYVRLFALSR
jgi:hypothetical protein